MHINLYHRDLTLIGLNKQLWKLKLCLIFITNAFKYWIDAWAINERLQTLISLTTKNNFSACFTLVSKLINNLYSCTLPLIGTHILCWCILTGNRLSFGNANQKWLQSNMMNILWVDNQHEKFLENILGIKKWHKSK